MTLSRRMTGFGVLFLATAVLLIAVSRSSLLQGAPGLLGKAIALDLLVTLPALYLAAIWRSRIPRFTVVPVFVAMLVLGHFIVPEAGRGVIEAARNYVLPAVELGAFAFIVFRIRGAMARVGRVGYPDYLDSAREASRELAPGRVADLLAGELAALHYAFSLGRNAPEPADGEQHFSYHLRSASVAIFVAIAFVALVETVAVHLLAHIWVGNWAWILTGISLYSLLFIIAHARATPRRPILAAADGLTVRYGLLGDARVPWSAIAGVEQGEQVLEKDKQRWDLGFGAQLNVRLLLSEELEGQGPYGIRRRYRELRFFADEPGQVAEAIARYREVAGLESSPS
ncbi:hypothetical protein ABI59_18945 [Acidobacteria bacterium Mor1]|nr:hypothetical protein ABI59_18945 [Acidobacteria bacterium Mor1]